MPYENLELLLAGVSGEIYLTRKRNGNVMSDSRRVITQECLRASTEWFMGNKKKMLQFESLIPNQKPTLFFTDDPAKIDQILAILEGGN